MNPVHYKKAKITDKNTGIKITYQRIRHRLHEGALLCHELHFLLRSLIYRIPCDLYVIVFAPDSSGKSHPPLLLLVPFADGRLFDPPAIDH